MDFTETVVPMVLRALFHYPFCKIPLFLWSMSSFINIVAGNSVCNNCHRAVKALRTPWSIILALTLPNTTCILFASKVLALGSLVTSSHPLKLHVLNIISPNNFCILVLTLIGPSNICWVWCLTQNGYQISDHQWFSMPNNTKQLV